MGQKITFKAHFDAKHHSPDGTDFMKVYFGKSEVRTKHGVWSKIDGGTCKLDPGESFSTKLEMKLGRTYKIAFRTYERQRRYRLQIEQYNHATIKTKDIYYPSKDGYTTKGTIDLGDIGRHFNW